MKRNRSNKIFVALLLISTLFMSIGYASVNSVVLDIQGLLGFKEQDDVYITSINYVSGVDSSESNNTISADYQTLINSKINLSSTNLKSQVTYQITVYNNTSETYTYYDTLYSTDEFFYDNEDIIVTTSGIAKYDELDPGEFATFTVTFKYKDGLTTIKENTLNSTINFKFAKAYTISYVDITNNDYPTKAFEGEDLTITFTGTVPPSLIVTGSESYSYTSPTLTLTNVQGNVTIKADYSFALDTYTFNGTSDYIDTGLYVFSDENINRDFEVSFNIENYTYSDFGTLVSAMDESGSPWPGFVFRYESSRYFTVANGKGSQNSKFYDASITKVLIQRIDNVLYYQIDDGNVETFFDFTGMTTTFDVPLTIGAAIDGNGNPFRYFKGTLSNITARFLDDDTSTEAQTLSLDEEETKEITKTNAYRYTGTYTFNGTTDYINTGVSLFSSENVNKNFEIVFNVTNYGTNEELSTIINSMDEADSSYPGFLFRYETENSTLKIHAVATSGTSDSSKYYADDSITKYRILRVNNILYYQFDDGNITKILDFSSLPNTFDTPVTIGASLDESGKVFRYFTGTISNIEINYLESGITIKDLE